ncbi:DeoR family transcriptional regulator [Kribbella sp. VKM Ac-2527]|uniref:DeoR family transcriptional regulator n=1 Tax=Kribbella caucasensis TaxID=2512215 RepID=A0A4R6K952_9ACTN|nr:DeoR/GlpR family DNA-binding transcription regulator [Kribbella sp. VKM Ac-2527]TDO46193.1 DeoR family transcriptional regulator [Kribbella sp. VKM Ac-2527]
MRHQRQLDIVQRLRTDGATSVDDLARLLGVSSATIRRDLQRLDEAGQITRVHGGAIIPSDDSEDADRERPFATVAADEAPDKRSVARLAATLIDDGDVVLLDVGTTTQLLARELRGRRVTVMTTSLAVLDVLRDDPAVELILLGGWVRRAYHSLVGVLTEDALRQVHADLAFLGASGVRRDGEVLDTTLVEVPVKRAMIEASDRAVLLADKQKFPGTGKLRVCNVADLSMVITNPGADPETLQICSDNGVEVLST